MLEFARERLAVKKAEEKRIEQEGNERVKKYNDARMKGTTGPKAMILGAREDIRHFSQRKGVFPYTCDKFVRFLDYMYPVQAENAEEAGEVKVETEETKEEL